MEQTHRQMEACFVPSYRIGQVGLIILARVQIHTYLLIVAACTQVSSKDVEMRCLRLTVYEVDRHKRYVIGQTQTSRDRRPRPLSSARL